MFPVNEIIQTDCLKGLQSLPDACVQCCITSPPYWKLRDYGVTGQLGMEDSPEEYVQKLVEIFSQVKRVLKPGGILWLNIGDGYWGSGKGGKDPNYRKGHTAFGKVIDKSKLGIPVTGKHPEIKNKDLMGIPWMLALALRKSGWYLRQDIIWHKPNGMPEPVKDRCTQAHEYIFLLTKNRKYYFDAKAISTEIQGKTLHDRSSRPSKKALQSPLMNNIKNGGGPYLSANRRSVWTITTKAFKGNHPAVFPPEIPERCIKAGSKEGDIILDPFMGAGTTAIMAKRLGRNFIGFELNPDYIALANERLKSNRK
jgi:DNA modification methylase